MHFFLEEPITGLKSGWGMGMDPCGERGSHNIEIDSNFFFGGGVDKSRKENETKKKRKKGLDSKKYMCDYPIHSPDHDEETAIGVGTRVG